MKKTVFKHLSNQRGVTLIELIAVIAILGIIAAVGVPIVFNQIQNAETGVDAANIAIMNDAISRYATVNGDFPTVNPANITTLITTLNAGTGGPYIQTDFPTTKADGTTTWTLIDDGGSTAADGDAVARIQ